jgi:hypothetical protein
MTLEDFVAEMRATAPQTPDIAVIDPWLAEKQAQAVSYGLDWQEIIEMIRDQQAASVRKAAETP